MNAQRTLSFIETGIGFSGDRLLFPGRCCGDPPPVVAAISRCWMISADGGGTGRPVRGRSDPPETSLRPHCPRRCSLGPFRNPRSLKRRPATPEDMNALRPRCSLSCPPSASRRVKASPARTRRSACHRPPAGRRATMSVMVSSNRTKCLPVSRVALRLSRAYPVRNCGHSNFGSPVWLLSTVAGSNREISSLDGLALASQCVHGHAFCLPDSRTAG